MGQFDERSKTDVGLDGVVHGTKFSYTGTLGRYIINGQPYGFIANDHGGFDFAHLNDFLCCGVSPRAGLRLRYQLGKDDQGRDRAINIEVIP